MKSFREFSSDAEYGSGEELTEGALRNLGAAALFARILAISKKIKRTKDVSEQNALLASQITSLAAVVLAVGEFLEKSNR